MAGEAGALGSGFGGALGRSLTGFTEQQAFVQSPIGQSFLSAQDAAANLAQRVTEIGNTDTFRVGQVAGLLADPIDTASRLQRLTELKAQGLTIDEAVARLREERGPSIAVRAANIAVTGRDPGAADPMDRPPVVVPEVMQPAPMPVMEDTMANGFQTTSLIPAGFGFSAPTLDFTQSATPPVQSPDPLGESSGGFLGTLGDVLTQALPIAQQLAQAGVIRGDVGEALAPNVGGAAGPIGGTPPVPVGNSFAGALARAVAAAAKRAAPAAMGSMAGNMMADMLGSGETAMVPSGGNVNDPNMIQQLEQGLLNAIGLGGGGGGASGPAQCPTLFRQSTARAYIPSRVQVVGPDGDIYVLANLGKATRGSREAAVMRRLAKDNGFKCARKGGR